MASTRGNSSSGVKNAKAMAKRSVQKKQFTPAAPGDRDVNTTAEDHDVSGVTTGSKKRAPSRKGATGGTVKSSKGVSSGAKRRSVSKRLNLYFPVTRIGRFLKKSNRCRIGAAAPVFIAGVLDYLVGEFIEIGASAARARKRSTMKPRDLQNAIRNDEDFFKLLGSVTMVQAGRGGIVDIQPSLLSTKAKTKSSSSTSIRQKAVGGDLSYHNEREQGDEGSEADEDEEEEESQEYGT